MLDAGPLARWQMVEAKLLRRSTLRTSVRDGITHDGLSTASIELGELESDCHSLCALACLLSGCFRPPNMQTSTHFMYAGEELPTARLPVGAESFIGPGLLHVL